MEALRSQEKGKARAVMRRASQLESQLEQRCGGGKGSGNFDSASFTQSSRAALTPSFVQSLPFLFPAFRDGLPGGLAVMQPRPWEAPGGSEAPDQKVGVTWEPVLT